MTSGPRGRLERAVTESFGPLLEEFHFIKVSGSEMAPEAWVTYQNGTTGITVQEEIGSAPWVKISRLDSSSGRPVEGEGYSLFHVLSLRAPAFQRQERAAHVVPLEEELAEQAALVRQYGADLLQGDFHDFPKLREIAQTQLTSAKRKQDA